MNTGLIAGAAINPMMLLGTGLQAGGAVADYYGTKDTNKTQREIAEATNRANAEIAQRQMDFQATMSNSAYQRAMADMKNAGLNPMLAYQQGGASTPAGAGIAAVSPSYQSPLSGISHNLKAGLSSAMDSARLSREMAQTDSAIALNNANIESQISARELNLSSAKAKNAETERIKTELPSLAARSKLEKANAETDLKYQGLDQTMKRTRQGMGLINDAKDIINPIYRMRQNETQGRSNNMERYYEKQQRPDYRPTAP